MWFRTDSASTFSITWKLRTPAPLSRLRPFEKLNLLLGLVIILSGIAGVPRNVSGETAVITSSGLHTHISGPHSVGGNTQYDITGGTRAGANLFHSFGNFDVPDRTVAYFHNDSMLRTDNILGRVTGGHISDIFGTIHTAEFANANLFLMNQAGFLFGPNASLNVGGAVTFTSADYLKFEDGRRFSATPSPITDSLLTAEPVAAFGFLGSNPGAITIQGSQLAVKNGKGISLVGGNIIIESMINNGTVRQAQLSTPSGNIQLASTASPGEFPVMMNALTLSPAELQTTINGTSFISFGALILAPNSAVNVSGTDTISIRGGQFVLSINDSQLSTANSTGTPHAISLNTDSLLTSWNSGPASGTDILLATGRLQINGAQLKNETSGTENAGSTRIHAEDFMTITDSLFSSSSTSVTADAGSAGPILLSAPAVEMIGSRVSSATLGPGHAGDIAVHSNILTLAPSPNDLTEFNASTSGTGHGGNISFYGLTGPGSRASSITLSGLSSLRSETQSSTGTAGHITIEAVRLALADGSHITTASSLNGSGDAGSITLDATQSVLVSGSFVSSEVSQGSTGVGGTISITTPKLTVDQGSVGLGGGISTSTSSSKSAGTITINSNSVFLKEGGRLSSNSVLEELMPPPTGAAGSIILQGVDGPGSQANFIVIGGKDDSGASSGVFTDTQGNGAGGNIMLNANQVQLHSGGTITANSEGEARAGNINITATNGLTMMQNGSITTRVLQRSIGSNAAGGGSIKITTSPSATIYLQNSTISASVGDGHGEGGNISIDPQLIILQNSKILAQADEGRGGRIAIVAGVFLPDANSVVNADSGSGVNGTVTIQSPTSNLSGMVGQLVSKTSPPQVLVRSRCAALVGGPESTFILAGRGTIPSEPGDWLLSPLAFATAKTSASTLTDTDPHVSSSNQTNARSLLSVRQIAPPWFLAKLSASDWPVGCRS